MIIEINSTVVKHTDRQPEANIFKLNLDENKHKITVYSQFTLEDQNSSLLKELPGKYDVTI